MRLMVIAALALGLLGGFTAPAQAQGYGFPPALSKPASGLVVTYGGGVVTSGGRQLTIRGGTVTVTANMADCQSPQFTRCNVVYWDGHSATLSTTTLPDTAFAVGNQVIAFVLTRGTTVTGIVGPILTPAKAPGASNQYLGLPLPPCNAVRRVSCRPCTGLGCA